MKKYLFILLTSLLLTVSASAAVQQELSAATLAKLSSTEQQQILSAISESKQTSSSSKLKEYAELGTIIGQALVGSARELGIAVNDFSKTDVGYLTTCLIVWNFVGHSAIKLFMGLAILIVGISMLLFILNGQRGGSYQTINGSSQFVRGKLDGEPAFRYAIGLIIILVAAGLVAC